MDRRTKDRMGWDTHEGFWQLQVHSGLCVGTGEAVCKKVSRSFVNSGASIILGHSVIFVLLADRPRLDSRKTLLGAGSIIWM